MLWFIPTAESHNTSRGGWWNFPSSICAWKDPQSYKRRGWGQKSKLDILRQTVNQRKGLKTSQMLTLTVTNLHLRHVNRVKHNPLTSFLSQSDTFLVPEHQQWSFWVQKVSIFYSPWMMDGCNLMGVCKQGKIYDPYSNNWNALVLISPRGLQQTHACACPSLQSCLGHYTESAFPNKPPQ